MAFKIQIVNISENANNILLTDNLTVETLKIKYNWIFNASIKDAIIGQNSKGLVWYMGEWICGEWENGTWYSGIWHAGTWKKGWWYAYELDRSQVLSGQYQLSGKNRESSQFRSGNWLDGYWDDGIFGYERYIGSGTTTSDIDPFNNIYTNQTETSFQVLSSSTIKSSFWFNGKWNNGYFYKSVWQKGDFLSGTMEKSYWFNGNFYNGTFQDFWWIDGFWYGGDFICGQWQDGSFNQLNTNIKSRFGISTISGSTWKRGNFNAGEFHSGLNIDISGNTIASKYHDISMWETGTFNNGRWYGGTFKAGTFKNGYWFDGVFGNDGNPEISIWENGKWYNGVWINGVWNYGHFYNGMWLNGTFNNGWLSTNYIENPLLTGQEIGISAPTVIAYPPNPLYASSAKLIGVATGSYISSGGFEWWETSYKEATRKTQKAIQSINFDLTIPVTGNTSYTFRAYSTNPISTTWSNEVNFTSPVDSGVVVPTLTVNVDAVGSTDIYVSSIIVVDGGAPILSYGFCWTTISGVIPKINNSDTKIFTGLAPNNFNYNINESIVAETDYYITAFAQNSIGIDGYGYSPVTGITTSSESHPTLGATTSSNICYSGSTLSSSIITIGVSGGISQIDESGFCLSDSNSLPDTGDTVFSITMPLSFLNFSKYVTGLTNNTLYYVRSYAHNSEGYGYGTSYNFTTTAIITPIVSIIESDISGNFATFSARITNYGNSEITEIGFCSSEPPTTPTSGVTNTINVDLSGLIGDVFSGTIIDLTILTPYRVKAFAKNLSLLGYSTLNEFTTTSAGTTVPTLSLTIGSISYTKINLTGQVISTGAPTLLRSGFCWANAPSPTESGDHYENPTPSNYNFTYQVTGLTPNTLYYINAFGANVSYIGYALDQSITTLSPTTPSVTTISYGSLSITGSTFPPTAIVTLYGLVGSWGYDALSSYGFVCKVGTSIPTISSYDHIVYGSTTSGSYNMLLAGLLTGTTYSFRSYSTNSYGLTGYGATLNFTTTSSQNPTVTTTISNIGYSGTTILSSVINNGNCDINTIYTIPGSTYGIYWASGTTVTTSSNHISGTTLNLFTTPLTGLLEYSDYTVMSYAKNICGKTGYSALTTFKTRSLAPKIGDLIIKIIN